MWMAGAPEEDALDAVASEASRILRAASVRFIARTIGEADRGGGIVKDRNRETGVTAPEGRQQNFLNGLLKLKF